MLCMATLKEIYRLPLRAAEGLLGSLMRLLGVELSVPSYSTLCRRRHRLEVLLPRRSRSEPLHLVVDATGVKVYGEGEWKVRLHGYSKRRTWRKLHLGVDEATGEVVAAVVSTNNFTDGQLLEELLDQVADEIKQVSGDGAYDKRHCYEAIGGAARAPSSRRRRGAHLATRQGKEERSARDEKCAASGRSAPGVETRERLSSTELAETTMFRLKTISAREWRRAPCRASRRNAGAVCGLEPMTHLGMPDSYAV